MVWVIRANEEERSLVALLSLLFGSAERLFLEDWLEHRLDPELHVVDLTRGIVLDKCAVDEQLNCRVATNAVLSAYTGLNSAVHLRKHDVLHVLVV